MTLKLGCCVELTDKNIFGKIAYIGLTKFAKGKWVGIILDEPKGKNNGVIDGITYFNCSQNHGIFVKYDSNSIKILNEDKTSSNNSLASSVSSYKSQKRKLSYGLNTSSKIIKPNKNILETSRINLHDNLEQNLSSSSNQISFLNQSNQAIATTNIKPISRLNFNLIDVKTIATNVTASLTNSNYQKSNNENVEALQTEVKDLNEKIEVLKKKLGDDKEKQKDFDKTKIHLQQLMEFKKQITESYADLKNQLTQAKRETKEAIEDKLRFVDEMKDLSETAEIATLDKEMAEEKYEILFKEFEQIKERLEEVTIDYELLKSKIEQHGTGAIANEHQVEQLQIQNARLKEAILKLKNLSDHEKNESQKLQKELNIILNEKYFLEKLKEKSQEEIKDLENQIADLKEQIDFGLSSQEMVEILTENNLKLEDRIKELEENIEELEEIHEVNEQLQETARETELELKEELDTMVVKLNEMQKKYEESQENLGECESTIQKLREIISKVKNENDLLKTQSSTENQNREEEKLKISEVQNMQYKMIFTEAKVFCRAIEMDLRRLEVIQANEYIKYLSLFMPDSFFIRGGDNDAIQILLFASRIIFKLHIISRQILQKFPINEEIEKNLSVDDLFQENELANQQLFIRKLLFLLGSIEFILGQFLDALKSCQLEIYLKIASLLPELSAHEKIIDNCIELLKKDQLDETISLETVERALSYFISLFTLYFSEGKIVNNDAKLLNNFIIILQHSTNMANLDLNIIEKCIDNTSLTKQISFVKLQSYLSEIKSMSKKIKRRLAGDQKIKLNQTVETEIRDNGLEINKIIKSISNLREKILEECRQKKLQTNKDINYLSLEIILKYFSNIGGIEFLEDSFINILSLCTQLTSGLQQGDYDEENNNSLLNQEEQLYSISSLNLLDLKNPLKQRAEYIKAQNSQVNDLKIKLDNEQNELNKMKKLLKIKNDDWQEMKIRKEIAEKKLQIANKEADDRVAKLQNELDDLTNNIKRKEKENEETMNHLQADIEALESEKGNLKEKIKQLSRKSLEGLVRSSILVNNINPSSMTFTSQTSNISLTSNLSAVESSYINQVNILKKALKETTDQLHNLKCKQGLAKLKELNIPKYKPLWLLRAQGKLNIDNQDIEFNKENINLDIKDNFNVDLVNLIKKLRKLEKEVTIALIEESRINANMSITMQINEKNLKKKMISKNYFTLQQDIDLFKKKYFSSCQDDEVLNKFLSVFQSKYDLTNNNVLAAKIQIPINKVKNKNCTSNVFSLEVTLKQLRELHKKLL